MTFPTDRSIPELFGDAVGQLAKLVGNEFALARAELSEKMAQAGRSAAMIAAGAGMFGRATDRRSSTYVLNSESLCYAHPARPTTHPCKEIYHTLRWSVNAV